MTFSEFEYWLDGLKEGMHGKPPTKTQWDKIQKKLKEVAPGPYYQWPYYPYYTHPNSIFPSNPSITIPAITWWNETVCQTDTCDSTSIPCTSPLTFSNATNTTKIPYALTN